jgi:hypothetical protein
MLGFIGTAMLMLAAHSSKRQGRLSGTPEQHMQRWKLLMSGATDRTLTQDVRDRALTRADEESLWFGREILSARTLGR